jgi:hypothetical protein
MRVEGEVAAGWTAVRLDSLESIEGAKGQLVMCDTDTGEVAWKDRTGQLCQLRLGANTIRLVGRR